MTCVRRFGLVLVLIILAAAAAVFAVTGEDALPYSAEATESFAEGTGTSSDPYIISTPADLAMMARLVGDDATYGVYGSAYYLLTADLDMAGVSTEPIGTSTKNFIGNFNGNSHIIKNLTIASAKTALYETVSDERIKNFGLFGVVGAAAEIKNVGLYSCTIGYSGYQNVGGIAGTNSGIISNCFVYGTITGNGSGGIVGRNLASAQNKVIFTYSSGTILGQWSVGGLIGYNSGVLSYSYSIASVSRGSGDATTVGALVGGLYSSAGLPVYSYGNSSLNPNIPAIGYGYSQGGTGGTLSNLSAPSTLDGNYLKTSGGFQSETLTSLFATEETKYARRFVETDDSAYYAPALKSFLPVSTAYTDNYYPRNSVAIRFYGYDNGEAEWGTEECPYLITNTNQLAALATAVAAGKSYAAVGAKPQKYFRLTNDLDLTGIAFEPVGYYAGGAGDKPFSGVFDGAGNRIINLSFTNNTADYIGFFGYVGSTGTVKNLTLDSSCSFRGKSYVGSLVGYLRGTVRNCETRASVSAVSTGYVGGAFGFVNGATLNSLLSAPTFLSATSNTFGVAGGGTLAARSNVWYFCPSSSSVRTTGSMGQTFVAGTANGTVYAQKSESGNITFTGEALPGWSVSFTSMTLIGLESYLSGSVFSPPMSLAGDSVVYANFVRALSVSNSLSGGCVSSLDSLRYYSGQNITLTLNIADGYYIQKIEFLNGTNNTGVAGTYNYKSVSPSGLNLTYTAVMTDDITSVLVTLGTISWNPGYFDSTHTIVYNGSPVLFDPVEAGLTIPEDLTNFSVNPVYSGGLAGAAPSAAGTYSLFVYMSANGINRGSKYVIYKIEKKHLVLLTTANLTKTKEFDNSAAPIDCGAVAAADIEGICGTDDVIVLAQMAFPSPAVGTGRQINYTFSLAGSAKNNYEAPVPATTADGTITKRRLKVTIVETDTYFAASDIEAAYMSYAQSLGIATATAAANYPDWLDLIEAQGITLASADYLTFYAEGYTPAANFGISNNVALSVSLKCSLVYTPLTSSSYAVTASFEDAGVYTYYNVLFDLGGETYDPSITLIMLPRPVSVLYSGAGGLIYNGADRSPSASYNTAYAGIAGITNTLSLDFKVLSGEEYLPTASVVHAGAYRAEVSSEVNGPQYFLINPALDFVIGKATPSPITITSASSIVYGDAYSVTYSGGAGAGAVATYSVTSGNAYFEGTPALIIGSAGQIVFTVSEAETADYLASQSSPFTLTVGKLTVTVGLQNAASFYSESADFVFTYNGQLVSPVDVSASPKIKINIGGSFRDYDHETLYGVGTYDICLDLSGITSVSGTLQNGVPQGGDEYPSLIISPLPVTVAIEPSSGYYGGTDGALKYVLTKADGTELDFTLNGTLARDEGVSVGVYDITEGTVTEANNPNFAISYDYTNAYYTILQAELMVTAVDKTKVYGASEPAITYTVSGLANSDTAQSIGLSGELMRIAGENVGSYLYALKTPFTHSSGNYKSVLLFGGGRLTVSPAVPVFTDVEVEELLGAGESLASVAPIATASGTVYQGGAWITAAIAGEWSWKNPAFIPDFSASDTAECIAVFTPSDPNFSAAEVALTLTVRKIEVTVTFGGNLSLVYNGSVQKTVTATFSAGEAPVSASLLGATVSYSGEMKNAGSYTATASITNNNYVLTGTKTVTVTIAKAPLKIFLMDNAVVFGASIPKNFIYDSFVSGEDESDLSALPDVNYPTAAGTHSVRPFGAAGANYNITYDSSTLVIFASTITAAEGEANFEGVFTEGVTAKVDMLSQTLNLSSYSNIATIYDSAAKNYTALYGKGMGAVYELAFFDASGEKLADGGARTMTVTLPEGISAENGFNILIITASGEALLLSTYDLDGDTVTFSVENAKYVVFATPKPNYTLYYAIGGAGGAVVLALAIMLAVKAKRKREARYIKFKD